MVYAEYGTNTVACHGNTTVYADHEDHLSSGPRVLVAYSARPVSPAVGSQIAYTVNCSGWL